MFGISFLCRAKANLHRGDAWVSGGSIAPHTGHGTSQVVAPIILLFEKKRKNGPNIASFNDHAHIVCWNYEKSSCTCRFLVKFCIKTSYVCPQTRNNKGTMVISVMLVLIYHGHYTHGSMKTPDSVHLSTNVELCDAKVN